MQHRIQLLTLSFLLFTGLFVMTGEQCAALTWEADLSNLQGPSGRVYRVQIMATQKIYETNAAIFQGLPVDRYHINYLYKYTTGVFTDSVKAEAHLAKIISMGFSDAFLVMYQDTYKDAAKTATATRDSVPASVLADLSTNSRFQEEGVVYRVQFKSSITPLNRLPVIDNNYAIRYKYDGLYRYTIGEFTNKTEAIDLLERVKQNGFADAFVAAFKDGERALDIYIYSQE